MSKSNSWENGLLLLLFNNTAFANVGDASGLQPSGTAGSLYVSLHTGDPGDAGDQENNEANYTGYVRVAVARNGSACVVTNNEVSPASDITFGTCTAGTNSVTHFGIGTAASGPGVLLYSGSVTPTISVTNTVTPVLNSATKITEE